MRALTLLLAFQFLTAEAPANDFANKCRYLTKRFAIWTLSKNWKNFNVTLTDLDSNEPISFATGPRINFGGWGSVYEIDSLSAPSAPRWDRPMVAKFPHGLTLTKGPLEITERENVWEAAQFTYLNRPEILAKLQSDPKYPTAPAWKSGTLPVLPQVRYRTEEGTILVKPKISGPSAQSLHDRGKLTGEMVRSLKELYDFTYAVQNQVKKIVVRSDKTVAEVDQPFYTDINPNNLVWVSRPEDLDFFGLSRPSFLLYEITALHHSAPRYLDLSTVIPFPSSIETRAAPEKKAVGQ